MSEKLKEAIQKEAEKVKERTEKLATAVAAARTRTGEPKVTKPKPKPKEEPQEEPAPVDKPARIQAFIDQETTLLNDVDIPEDTGDAMFNAVEAVLYYKERISKAELAKKHFEEA